MEEIIKKNRPNLTLSGIRTYTSIIKNIGKKINETLENDKDIKKNFNKIVDSLKDVEPRKRKTIYSAILVLCDTDKKDDDLYEEIKNKMMNDIGKYKETEYDQEKTEKQNKNWMSWEEVLKKYENLENEIKDSFNKKEVTKKEFLKMNLYILLSCLLLIPPLRSLNYTEFKIRNIDQKNDNYLKNQKFYFNVYKNSNTKGQSVINIPKKLNDLIKKWSEFNETEYLLLDSTAKNKLTQSKLNNLLNNFFDKKISTGMLRHIYLTHKFSNINLKDIYETSQNMQHNIITDLKYVVK